MDGYDDGSSLLASVAVIVACVDSPVCHQTPISAPEPWKWTIRMPKFRLLAAAGLLTASTLTTTFQPASADGPECDHYDHCYGIANYSTGEFSAVGQELWTDCLVLDTPLSDVATHEMWVWTNAPHTSEMVPFIEAGYVKGGIAGGDTATSFRWFWAEWTGTAFSSHYISAAPILNWINFSFYRQSNNTWKVYANSVERGTTVQQASAGTYLQTGGETTEPQVYSHGKSRYLQWYSIPNNAWTWGNGAMPTATSNVYTVRVNESERMEQTSLQKLCDPLPGGPTGLGLPNGPSEQDIKELSTQFANLNGEKTLDTIEMVRTKRQAAQKQIRGGTVDSDQDVYLVQLAGSFTGDMIPRPPRSKAPRGNTITLAIDGATGEVTDWSLSNERRDLRPLGAVETL